MQIYGKLMFMSSIIILKSLEIIKHISNAEQRQIRECAFLQKHLENRNLT